MKEWTPMSVVKGFSRMFNKLSFMALALLILEAGCGGGGGTGSGTGTGSRSGDGAGISGPMDTTPPTVTAMSPAQDAAGVETNGRLTATFSEAMVPATINAANFRLATGASYIPGTVSYDTTNNIAVFTPTGSLEPYTRYTATIITGIKDLGGNPLTRDFAWDFVTGGSTDGAAPIVTATIPTDAATGMETNQSISANFNEDMNSLTLTPVNFTVTGPGANPISGTVSYIRRTAIFTPLHALASNTAYTALITTGATDLVGNALPANVTWSFTTGGNADVTAPIVISTNPADTNSGVAISSTINVSFTEPMAPETITTANFKVTGPGTTPVIGTVAFDAASNTATFTRINHLTTPVAVSLVPVNYLDPNTTYTATLTTGAKDMAGVPLANNLVWSFTTAP